MDNDQPNTQPLIPANATVDFKLSGEYDRFFWSFSVNNVFNALYYDYAIASAFTPGRFNAYPLPGRTFWSRPARRSDRHRSTPDRLVPADARRYSPGETPGECRSNAATRSAAIDLLHEQIADADTQWSLGTFGGIAEFSRDRDEKVSLTQSATGASAVTARGGIAIELSDDCRPFAFESMTRTGWSQRVALCLPADDCAMNRRTVLTELDADHDALRPEHRGSILFDLGLGALQADLCVRIDDPDAVAQLRGHCGRSVFDPAIRRWA